MLDDDIEAVESFIKGNSDYGPLHCAFIRIKNKVMEAQPQATNSRVMPCPHFYRGTDGVHVCIVERCGHPERDQWARS